MEQGGWQCPLYTITKCTSGGLYSAVQGARYSVPRFSEISSLALSIRTITMHITALKALKRTSLSAQWLREVSSRQRRGTQAADSNASRPALKGRKAAAPKTQPEPRRCCQDEVTRSPRGAWLSRPRLRLHRRLTGSHYRGSGVKEE